MTTKKRDDETPPAEEGGVVEMDAMDEDEWEKDQHTPRVQTEKMQKLVKESASRSGGLPAPVADVAAKPATPPQATVKTVKRVTRDLPPPPSSTTNPADKKAAGTQPTPTPTPSPAGTKPDGER